MALRQELLWRPADPGLVAKLSALIETTGAALEAGTSAEAGLDDIRRLSGKAGITANDVDAYWSHSSATALAERFAGPAAAPVPDLSRAELEDIVTRIQRADGSEAEEHYYIALFARNVPNPAAEDLIFWPPEDWLARLGRDQGSNPPTPSEIVDEALRA